MKIKLSIIQIILLFGTLHYSVAIYNGIHEIKELKQKLIKTEGDIDHTWTTVSTDVEGDKETTKHGIILFRDTNNLYRKFKAEVPLNKNIGGKVIVYHDNENIARLFLTQSDRQEIIRPIGAVVFCILFFVFLSLWTKKKESYNKFSYFKIIPAIILLAFFIWVILFGSFPNETRIKENNLVSKTTAYVTDLVYTNNDPYSTLVFSVGNEKYHVSSWELLLTKSNVSILYNPKKPNVFMVEKEPPNHFPFIFVPFLMIILLLKATPLGNFLTKYHIA